MLACSFTLHTWYIVNVFSRLCSVHYFLHYQDVGNENTDYPDQQNHHSPHHQAPQSNQSTDQQVSTF